MTRIAGAFLILAVAVLAGCSEPEASPGQSPEGKDGGKAVSERAGDSTADTSKTIHGQESTEGAPKAPEVAGAKPAQDTPSASSEPALPEDPETAAAVEQLLAEVASEAAVERRAASDALDQLGQAGMPYIVRGLREGTLPQRIGAATYLIGRVSPRDVNAVPALVDALAAEDESLRRAALQAVEKMSDGQLLTALPALLAYAQNPAADEAYRSRAVRAITKLGPDAEAATASIIQLARGDAPLNTRRAAFYAIAKIAAPQAAEQFYVTELQRNPEADLRRLAAKWLRPPVITSESSLNALVKALSDADAAVRLEAVDVLVEVGKPSLSVLIAALESQDVETRRHAVLAIGKLGLLATDAVAPLRKRLEDPDQQVRDLAAATLKSLGP